MAENIQEVSTLRNTSIVNTFIPKGVVKDSSEKPLFFISLDEKRYSGVSKMNVPYDFTQIELSYTPVIVTEDGLVQKKRKKTPNGYFDDVQKLVFDSKDSLKVFIQTLSSSK